MLQRSKTLSLDEKGYVFLGIAVAFLLCLLYLECFVIMPKPEGPSFYDDIVFVFHLRYWNPIRTALFWHMAAFSSVALLFFVVQWCMCFVYKPRPQADQ